MNARDLASLACKILGIYLIIAGIMELPELMRYSELARQVDPDQSKALLPTFLLLMYLFKFGAGLLLWRWSDNIAWKITGNQDVSADKSSVSGRDLVVIGCVLAGVLIVRYSFPFISQYFAYLRVQHLIANVQEPSYGGLPGLLEMDWKQRLHSTAITGLIAGLISLVLGLFVLIRSRTILRWVYRPRSGVD
jgi:thiamine transporter ThiT